MNTNPYQPPAQGSEPSHHAGSRRPTAATAFGILHLLFGVTSICYYGLNGALQLISRISDLELIEEISQYPVLNPIGMLLGLAASAVLMAAGVGLLRLRSYGRTLSIGYGVYAIVVNVFDILYSFESVLASFLVFANSSSGWPAEAVLVLIGVVVGTGMRLAYAGLLLYFMFRPNIVAAFKK